MFQFHDGAIKRYAGSQAYQQASAAFQFHDGAIKREQTRIYKSHHGWSFNSMMVRLKVALNSGAIDIDGVSIP